VRRAGLKHRWEKTVKFLPLLASLALLGAVPGSDVNLVEGTWTKYSDPSWPHPQKSRLLETLQGGVAVLEDGAGLYLMVKPLAPFEKTLYATIEYPNPADPKRVLVNDAELSARWKEYQFSSPELMTGLEAGVDYKVTVRIFDSMMSKQPIDILVQPIRSNVDTRGPKPKIFPNAPGPAPTPIGEIVPEPWTFSFDSRRWRLAAAQQGEVTSHFYVPASEFLGEWSERVTSEQGPAVAPRALYDHFIKAMGKDCPSLVVGLISETSDSMTFEWRCPGREPKHELRKVTRTAKGIFLLSYTKKTVRLDAAERKTWLAILEAAKPPR
jgi:hypothetical protein